MTTSRGSASLAEPGTPGAIKRAVLIGLLLLLAELIQRSLLADLKLPGATPDPVLVVVVAVALSSGPMTGLLTGFAGGLLEDLAPPSLGVLGLSAAVLAVIGRVCGGLRADARRSAVLPLAIVTAAAMVQVLAYSALATLLGSNRVTISGTVVNATTAAIYAAVMAPLLLPGTNWLLLRTIPRAVREATGLSRPRRWKRRRR